MKLQVAISEVSFNSPAHYFIKLALTHDPNANDSKSSQRTQVSPTCSSTPLFAQTMFYFQLPSNHPLTTLSTSNIRKSVLNMTACCINQETTPPSISVVGNVSLVVFPHASLQRNILDMQIVYFLDGNQVEVGKCIVTLSISKSGEIMSEKIRLDPVDSFIDICTNPSMLKTKVSEKMLSTTKSPLIKGPEITVSPTSLHVQSQNGIKSSFKSN